MQNNLEKVIQNFLKQQVDPNKPILLGLSGGPDSFALYQILVKLNVNFSAAYIDHGWREESQQEAKLLRKMAQGNGIAFYTHKIQYPEKVGNLEAFCREERFAFFKKIVNKKNLQGVLLGHHAGDLGENVLKRVLEGAYLPFIGGMRPVSTIKGLKIFRPLLFTPKAEILGWLQNNPAEIQPFDDKTNRDHRFLRARMREDIIPTLEKKFGKKIANSLFKMGKESVELISYLEEKVSSVYPFIKKNGWGYFIPFKDFELKPYEKRFFLRDFLSKKGFSLSEAQFEDAFFHLNNFSANKNFLKEDKIIYVDRGHIFLLEAEIPDFKGRFPIKEGSFETENFTIHITKGLFENEIGWHALWEDGIKVSLLKKDLFFDRVLPSMGYKAHKNLDKYWNEKKIPALFRSKLPGIFSADSLEMELLANPSKKAPGQMGFKVHLVPKPLKVDAE